MAARGSLRFLGLLAGIVCACIGAASLVSAAVEEASHALPRYKLQTGQQLNYEGNESFEMRGTTSGRSERWQITVLGQNADGTYRILLRQASTPTRVSADGKETKGDESVTMALADLDSVGNITERLDSFGFSFDPRKVLPKLPTNEAEWSKGWQEKTTRFDGKLNYRVRPSNTDNIVTFDLNEDRIENQVYGVESQDVITFNTERGWPEKGERTSKQTWGINSTAHGERKFVDATTLDADACKKLAADAETYFNALQQFSKVNDDDEATDEALASAVEAFKETRNKFENTDYQAAIDRELQSVEGAREYRKKSREERNALVGQQAEEFATTDLEGKPQALVDYRGKVVLLDFWYRGCGWCIRSMPQLKELADHYQDQPVVLVGMNIDEKVDDAKFVVEKLGLNYPNLKAEDLPKKFNVHGYPTMIIVDQHGKIRHVHSGWSPTLKEDLIKIIDPIVAEGKEAKKDT